MFILLVPLLDGQILSFTANRAAEPRREFRLGRWTSEASLLQWSVVGFQLSVPAAFKLPLALASGRALDLAPALAEPDRKVLIIICFSGILG